MKQLIRTFAPILIVILACLTASASQEIIFDRRITLADAKTLAENAKKDSEFPIVINKYVLWYLNYYLGSERGREYMQNALREMENYRSLVEEKIQTHELPIELMAVPIIESGYQNLSEKMANLSSRAAGLWMFIPSTARSYGLRINRKVDERLNEEVATNAAMLYLKEENLYFNNWLLALLSYNMGRRKVLDGIAATKSKNAWTLIRNGYEGDKGYIPKMIAAIIVMKNPAALEQ